MYLSILKGSFTITVRAGVFFGWEGGLEIFKKAAGHFHFGRVFERTFSFALLVFALLFLFYFFIVVEGGGVKISKKSKCPTNINCE